mmetsp:Transcript_26112/g.49034  ORF Transcript_26112/g.49034 Transcript_26112/m.49034 type:complete len:125 (+) Transcript_26112:35-409(+)
MLLTSLKRPLFLGTTTSKLYVWGGARVLHRKISNTVHIKGLPVSIQREYLYERCEGFGSISSLFINKSFSGKSSVVTVTFKSIGSAISIVDELDGMDMMGRMISVKFSTRLDPKPTSNLRSVAL